MSLKDRGLFLWLRGYRREKTLAREWRKKLTYEFAHSRFEGRKPTGAMRLLSHQGSFPLTKDFKATIQIEWEEERFEVSTIWVDVNGIEKSAVGVHRQVRFWSRALEISLPYGEDDDGHYKD